MIVNKKTKSQLIHNQCVKMKLCVLPVDSAVTLTDGLCCDVDRRTLL